MHAYYIKCCFYIFTIHKQCRCIDTCFTRLWWREHKDLRGYTYEETRIYLFNCTMLSGWVLVHASDAMHRSQIGFDPIMILNLDKRVYHHSYIIRSYHCMKIYNYEVNGGRKKRGWKHYFFQQKRKTNYLNSFFGKSLKHSLTIILNENH